MVTATLRYGYNLVFGGTPKPVTAPLTKDPHLKTYKISKNDAIRLYGLVARVYAYSKYLAHIQMIDQKLRAQTPHSNLNSLQLEIERGGKVAYIKGILEGLRPKHSNTETDIALRATLFNGINPEVTHADSGLRANTDHLNGLKYYIEKSGGSTEHGVDIAKLERLIKEELRVLSSKIDQKENDLQSQQLGLKESSSSWTSPTAWMNWAFSSQPIFRSTWKQTEMTYAAFDKSELGKTLDFKRSPEELQNRSFFYGLLISSGLPVIDATRTTLKHGLFAGIQRLIMDFGLGITQGMIKLSSARLEQLISGLDKIAKHAEKLGLSPSALQNNIRVPEALTRLGNAALMQSALHTIFYIAGYSNPFFMSTMLTIALLEIPLFVSDKLVKSKEYPFLSGLLSQAISIGGYHMINNMMKAALGVDETEITT